MDHYCHECRRMTSEREGYACSSCSNAIARRNDSIKHTTMMEKLDRIIELLEESK